MSPLGLCGQGRQDALARRLAAFGPLELEGVKITLGPESIAFSLFSALNSQMADIHFKKADPAVKGASQMINWETATRLADRFKYLNREQDLGIPGLRQAKRSYDPECLLLPYHLRRKT